MVILALEHQWIWGQPHFLGKSMNSVSVMYARSSPACIIIVYVIRKSSSRLWTLIALLEGFLDFLEVHLDALHMGISINGVTPKWMVCILEYPTKMDDLRVPLFQEPPHISLCLHNGCASSSPGERRTFSRCHATADHRRERRNLLHGEESRGAFPLVSNSGS